jgi:hypothetical protein
MVMARSFTKSLRSSAALVVFLAEVFLDVLAIGRGQAGITDHLPRRHVAVAAVDRVGEKALHADVEQSVEEHAAGKAGKLRLAGFHRFQRRFAVGVGEAIEILAVGLARPLVGGGDAGAEEFARIERQLIAELGLALGKRPVAIKPRPTAVSPGQLTIDEGSDAALAA